MNKKKDSVASGTSPVPQVQAILGTRPDDMPIPDGFTDIDDLVRAREADPLQRERMYAARRRVRMRLQERDAE